MWISQNSGDWGIPAIALLFYRHSSDRTHKNTTGDRTTRAAIAFLVKIERAIALRTSHSTRSGDRTTISP
ncbi:MAG: hypothetical protein DSM106950_44975 [Stigonema ocellatum SAG 48.90 = DSM 106950]|nr:hypothetical protein [Stigonema ocellatum SAG 48.90 = DSM 106950]